ncbi:hypothetical protein VB715_10530 [Crocosphaera sp. UHCC 0190]|uniref:hypothetical protein n=1 Tax=Crocosphaera sp. UHCC 0190 TaxID=3110246 RepID=UPI002B2168F5|nr:hypothetical protein [Crocosphaera sp. UHCC 0190]MEA5510197.1 hypothetical protein [Crocosphaera sp. UHCC 0190]
MIDIKPEKPSQKSFDKPSENYQLIEELQKRLISASPEEIETCLQIYREIIQQNELIKFNQHQRTIENFQIIRQTSLWGIIISIGVALIISRLTVPGLILIGVVFYDFVFDYQKFRK